MTTIEEIQQRINSRLTIEANQTEGGFSQDIIGSVSYELGNIYDTEINNILDKAFVTTATGEYLDYAAADYGLTRRQAQAAIVYLQITGVQDAIVNTNIKAQYDNLTYSVQEYKVIGSTGVVLVKALCDTLGSVGNVEANTINEFAASYEGLTAVTNPSAAYDGFNQETDETFRARIKAYLAEDAINCNKAQYKQWALEVTGVDKAVVKGAETAGAGNVGVYISAVGSSSVSAELIATVKDYIEERQFINANVVVSALSNVNIDVDAEITLKPNYTVNDVETEFTELLNKYFSEATSVVSYFKCSDLLFSCAGVENVIDITLNNARNSISITDTQIARLGDVDVSL